jgi:hypothetical protein
MTSSPEPVPTAWTSTVGHMSAEDLVRLAGVKPITSVEELIEPDAFESDEELDEFLADLYASRRADLM